MSKTSIIAVIDDDESARQSLDRLVKSLGFETEGFASAEQFLRLNRMRSTACLVIDVHMIGMGGLHLQSHFASAGLHIPIVFVTTSPDANTRAQAVQSGALDVLHKPSGVKALQREIRSALRVEGGDKHRE